MKDSSFQKYLRNHVQFYDRHLPLLLRQGLAVASEMVSEPTILDLGCGNGRLTFALHEMGLLSSCSQIVGVDISKRSVERLAKELPFVKGIVSDALNVKRLEGDSFDFVICSQLIEHVENDKTLLQEIRRLLRNRRLVYMASVIKKSYGVYFYYKNGSFRLDPTHVREYASVNEFVDLIANNGFEVISVRTGQIMFPVLDLLVRLFIRVGLVKDAVKFYQQHRILGGIRRVRMPVFGYSGIEVLARKNG